MSAYTKEEARTKWCPFARERDAGAAGVAAINRRPDGARTKCIASDCMAWRAAPETTSLGYCGLAGRPE